MSFVPPEAVPPAASRDGAPPPPPPLAEPAESAPPTQFYYGTPGAPGQPPYYSTTTEPANPRTLGVVAFVAGIVVFVMSVTLWAFIGYLFGSDGNSSSSDDPKVATSAVLILIDLVVGTGLGVWALVQGILATRQRRGRSFGILAIVLAGATPVVSLLVFVVVSIPILASKS